MAVEGEKKNTVKSGYRCCYNGYDGIWSNLTMVEYRQKTNVKVAQFTHS